MTIQIDKLKGPLMHEHKSSVNRTGHVAALGALYNWYAVNDPRKIAMDDFRIPTKADFDILIAFLGGINIAGGKLKETGSTNWITPNTGATNETGFNGRGSGYRFYSDGLFMSIRNLLYIYATDPASIYELNNINSGLTASNLSSLPAMAVSGFSIRLMRNSVLPNGSIGIYRDYEGIEYKTVVIGGQEWMSENLRTEFYTNGDPIEYIMPTTEWLAATYGAYCFYDNVPANGGNSGISTDNAIVRWDGRDAKNIQNSRATIDDNGNMFNEAEANEYGFSVGGHFTGKGTYGYGVVGAATNIPITARNTDTTPATSKRAFVKEGSTSTTPEIGYGIYEEVRLPSKRSDHLTNTLLGGKDEIIYTEVAADNESTDQIFYLLKNGALLPRLKISSDAKIYVRNSTNTAWILIDVPTSNDGSITVSGLDLSVKSVAFKAEIVNAPTSGNLTLKLSTETYIGTLTNANAFTVVLPAPLSGYVNESVLIFKIGASLPTITMPTGIVWRVQAPTLTINSSFTIVFEQVNTTGSTFEIWGSYNKNV